MTTATIDRPLVAALHEPRDHDAVEPGIPAKQLLRWQDDGGAVTDLT